MDETCNFDIDQDQVDYLSDPIVMKSARDGNVGGTSSRISDSELQEMNQKDIFNPL